MPNIEHFEVLNRTKEFDNYIPIKPANRPYRKWHRHVTDDIRKHVLRKICYTMPYCNLPRLALIRLLRKASESEDLLYHNAASSKEYFDTMYRSLAIERGPS